jgi:ArsR family transcriptional regulator
MGTDAERDASALADLMKLLSDGTRLRILLVLGEGEANVSDLCRRLGLNQPTASHHLGILKRAGISLTRRDGKRIYYRLADPAPTPGTVRVAAGTVTIRVQLG